MPPSKQFTWISVGSFFRGMVSPNRCSHYFPRRFSSPTLQNHLKPNAPSLDRSTRRCFGSYERLCVAHTENGTNSAAKEPKRKTARSPAGSSSLRRVAVEAQRSQRSSIIKGKGKSRHVDPEANTKEVTAYCAAETYKINHARDLLRKEGYHPDPFNTSLFPQVLHIQTPNYIIQDEVTGEDRPRGRGDVFVFPSGTVVTWNVNEQHAHNLVSRVLLPAAENGHLGKLEAEDLDYIEDPTKETSLIVGDTIILGTKAAPQQEATASNNPNEQHSSPDGQSGEIDTVLAKIAFSSALARSTKLAVLENLLSSYFESTRSIPATLAAGSQLRITRSFILQKTGELLSIRAQLNLYSELTDALPDLFWDSPHELGLEGYYEQVGRALDVGVRIKVLNEKMDYASEIAAVLRERLSEKHSTGLEWMIIGLITIEVGFGILHLWRESVERDTRAKTEEMLQLYLERELGRRAN